jgi:hypothetical protein
MTLREIQEHIMHQTNNDADDLGDYVPHIGEYINEAYDRIVEVWADTHVPSDDYPRLDSDEDEPSLPQWIHRYIADWATWLIYRNGNPQKQQRGMQYRSAFEETLAKIADSGGADGLNEDGTQVRYKNFRNIPT